MKLIIFFFQVFKADSVRLPMVRSVFRRSHKLESVNISNYQELIHNTFTAQLYINNKITAKSFFLSLTNQNVANCHIFKHLNKSTLSKHSSQDPVTDEEKEENDDYDNSSNFGIG